MQFILMVILFSLVMFAYPVWRLGEWLQLPMFLHIVSTLMLFSSQFVARFVLRNNINRTTYLFRRAADFFLGMSPVLFGIVLLIELLNLGLNFSSETLFSLALAGLFITLVAGLWGLSVAWTPDIVKVNLLTDKLGKPVRFVQISDVHIGSRTTRFLEKTMQRIEAFAA